MKILRSSGSILRCGLLAAAVSAALSSPAQTTEPVVLSRKVVQAADHKIIFERIVPPVAAVETTPAVAASGASSPVLPRRLLSLSCSVFNHEFTELRWWDAAGGEYVVWSSIDFTPFMGRSTGGFVLGGVRYELFMGLGQVPAVSAAGPLSLFRGIVPPTGPGSWYAIVRQPEVVPEGAFAGVNALHVYYDANKAVILADHAQVKAANAAREAQEAALPRVKRDTLIRFWPVQSALHGTSHSTSGVLTKEEAP